ncbi:uncharacterized protein E0L32_008747 [Thyridium curvatum]|uniref:Uncharacterized protein n=1 Tax=Thyridium curvatum TaxID=1093900 RepID=A0A507AKZ5_9PEZI|nr:uncharacterized protein E0L32_008747 [Thyridium curvatum]TPX10342.1 hypothetical protein E0L32_008747 [Thyridium curvatum]
MHLSSLLSILGTVPVMLALSVPRGESLEPWEVSQVSVASPPSLTSQPSLRSYLSIIIADPNIIDGVGSKSGPINFQPSIAQCNVSWYAQDGEQPYDQSRNCTLETGYPAKWSFVVVPPNREYGAMSGGALTNFSVQFTLVDEIITPVNSVRKVYVGEGHFEVGENMEGLCGASGICAFSLRNESAPVLIEQTRVE